jgi:FixJ family two-component response regulator
LTTIGFVAIVDDDSTVRNGLSRLLRAAAIPSRCYASGREFLSSLTAGAPACLLLDVQMPDMTGPEVQSELLRRGKLIPTIMITANGEPGLRDRCLAAGAAAFLTKPLDVPTVLSTIESLARS